MEKRTFKVSETLAANVENVLKRRGISYQMKERSCEANLSGEQFHKVVLRAKMEKMTEEAGSPIPFIASVEEMDALVMSEVDGAYIIKD